VSEDPEESGEESYVENPEDDVSSDH